MNRRDLSRLVTARLKDNGARKHVRARSHTFRISDDEGNTKDFVLKAEERDAIYTIDDVEAILNETVNTALDLIKRGDNIAIQGFGTLGVKYRRRSGVPGLPSDSPEAQEGSYHPKFKAGSALRLAAKLFGLHEKEREKGAIIPSDPSFWGDNEDDEDAEDGE